MSSRISRCHVDCSGVLLLIASINVQVRDKRNDGHGDSQDNVMIVLIHAPLRLHQRVPNIPRKTNRSILTNGSNV